MPAPAWLTAHPIAHRGLHDSGRGVIENTLPAAIAAIARGFAIECDVQLSRCGEAMVFHDDTLDRLTTAHGPLVHHAAVELRQVRFKDTSTHIPTLRELLDEIAGRVPLVIEVKSHFDGAPRLVERVGHVLQDYQGPAAVMSFDPKVIPLAREVCHGRPIGIVAEVMRDDGHWRELTPFERYQNSELNHALVTRPDFVAYNVRHLPSVACEIMRHRHRLPLLTWTVRNELDRETAARYADQMIFEGFVP